MSTPLADRIATMHWLFDRGDSRKEDVRTLAAEVAALEVRVTGRECVKCIKCRRCVGACDCTGGPQAEPECSCYEVIGGHQPGCYFNRTGAPRRKEGDADMSKPATVEPGQRWHDDTEPDDMEYGVRRYTVVRATERAIRYDDGTEAVASTATILSDTFEGDVPGQQPGSCSPACVHLMEAATLSAQLVEAEERLEKCMVALRACAGLQFGKCPICGHRISQCDKNPIWGDETCGGHLARVALKAVRP